MKFKRVPLVAYFCLLPVLLALGIWQLNRADEKRTILDLQQHQGLAAPLILSPSMPDDIENTLYKRVQATGRYDTAHQFLLDNKVYKGRAGYFVLTPFLLAGGGKAVLVNRGWLPLGDKRSDLPDIAVAGNEILMSGRINHFPSVGLKLAGAEMPGTGWPAIVQVIDTKVLSKRLGYPLFDFQVELDKSANQGFVREWQQPVVMTPEKHLGYAVQWFLLALTLTVLFVKYGRYKNHD